jgi:dTDP-4-dehydrorhamnose reductase
MKIAVLGTRGMLGSMVEQYFSNRLKQSIDIGGDFDLISVNRPELNARWATQPEIDNVLRDADWIINCVGIIKPYIKNDPVEAIEVNSLFPHRLAKYAEAKGKKVIQIATDCVYSGKDLINNGYVETDEHDATDIYGKTKSLGEVESNNFYNIRTSIIGPQPTKEHQLSLLQWFLDLPKDAKIKGYTSHVWNGVTTLAFAKVCAGIILNDNTKSLEVRNFHLIPSDSVTKYELLEIFKKVYGRNDIEIEPVLAPICNRKLNTIYDGENRSIDNLKQVWTQAGYEQWPTIEQLVYSLKENK